MWSPDSDHKKVSSVVHPHHVISVTKLLEQSLIQSLLLTHHCYSHRRTGRHFTGGAENVCPKNKQFALKLTFLI